MIAVDSNLLVFAHFRQSPWHARASAAIKELAESGVRWAIPWHCLHEFYAIATNAKVYKPCSTGEAAVRQIEIWLAAPTLTLLAEDTGTWPILRELITAGRTVGPAMYDARIAALCLQHGVTELWTHDRDFSRLPALRVRNPLIDVYPARASERREIRGSSRSHEVSRGDKARRARS